MLAVHVYLVPMLTLLFEMSMESVYIFEIHTSRSICVNTIIDWPIRYPIIS